MSEVAFGGLGTSEEARKKIWAIAMGGAYVMVNGWDIATTPEARLKECGYMVKFFASTNLSIMSPHDELKFGGTEYVMALPGHSYVAYASNLSGNIGLRNLTRGRYQFQWYDVISGTRVVQTSVSVPAGDQTWNKPNSIGAEMAVYIVRDGLMGTPGNFRVR
jgi:hypothetical protein